MRFGVGHLADVLGGNDNEKVRGFGHDRLQRCPDLAPLREDPRFHRLVELVQVLAPGGPK